MSRHRFEITFKGAASELMQAEFDDVTVTVDGGVTRLRVTVGDDSVLHGILDRIAALGLELLDVHGLDDMPPASAETQPGSGEVPSITRRKVRTAHPRTS